MSPRWQAPWAFARALALQGMLTDRASIDRWQERKLAQLLVRARQVRAFQGLNSTTLGDWPVMDKAALMGDFGAYNRLDLPAERAWHALDDPALLPGYGVGASTGTSGNRGLFLVSDAERFFWLGVMLARTLPQALIWPQRVALVLPTTSRLYESANESGWLKLKFFDVGEGVASHIRGLESFAPTVIIGAPHGLRALAETDTNLKPAHVFSGAEVLDQADRALIEARFGVVVREIYMATEGLFGVACRFGRLHLLEDHVHFDWETDPGGGPLVSPLITDFTRQTQYMIRYRMNDLLEFDDAPCPCGSPHQAVKAIHGRADDVLIFAGGISVTPDVIRNAIVTTDRSITDFRAVQTGPESIRVHLPDGPPALADEVSKQLASALRRAGVESLVALHVSQGDIPPIEARKLRRVSRAWQRP
jgi:putative adenylate-forming enzyme